MSNEKWYKRKNQFTPYTTADGRAVADELDRVQASFERIPTMRDDGKGFEISPVIPEPTEDNHPVPYKMFKDGTESVLAAKKITEQKAQEVSVNAGRVATNTAITQSAKESAGASAVSAHQSKEEARQYAEQARVDKTFVEQARKQVETNTQTVNQKAQQVSADAEEVRRNAHALGGNNATTSMPGVVQLSSETQSDAEDKAATPKAIKLIWDKMVKLKNSLVNEYLPLTGGKMSGAITGKHHGQGVYNQQFNTGAPFFVSAEGTIPENSFHPFVKGKVRENGNWGASFSFGMTSHQPGVRPNGQSGRGVICLNKDSGDERIWEFDHDGVLYGVDFHAHGTGTMRHLRDQIFSVDYKADEALNSHSVGWYPSHYAGAHTFRNKINHQLITVIDAQIPSGSEAYSFNLPEKYNGFAICLAQAATFHSRGYTVLSCYANVENDGRTVKVFFNGAWQNVRFRIMVIGYY